MLRESIRKPTPSAGLLKQKFKYDPETGFLTHLLGRFKGERAGSCSKKDGYRYMSIDGQTYMEARIVWKLWHGYEPDFIDHINGIRDDNRIANLRNVSQGENNRNAKVRRENVSGIPGVTPRDSKWAVHITHDGTEHYIGRFDTLEQAAHARRTVEKIAGYHPNHGRQA